MQNRNIRIAPAEPRVSKHRFSAPSILRAAYGMKAKADPLAFLLALNHEVAVREAMGESVIAPGLPPCVTDPKASGTDDCVQVNGPD